MATSWAHVEVRSLSWEEKQGIIGSLAGAMLTEEEVMTRLAALLPGFEMECDAFFLSRS